MLERIEEELTRLERHFTVLKRVIEEQPVGIANLSTDLDYPTHKVRYSLRVLETKNIIEATPQGAVTTEQAGEVIADHMDRLDGVSDQLAALDVPDSGE